MAMRRMGLLSAGERGETDAGHDDRVGTEGGKNVRRLDADGTTWVRPRLVVEVGTLMLTKDHRLRQPAYVGLRADLTPEDLQEVEDGG